MKSNIAKMALVFSLLLMLVSGFVIAYLLAGYRGSISLQGTILEFKNGSVPVISFVTPDGKQMHFSDALASLPTGKKQGDNVTIQYVQKTGKVRIAGTTTIEWIIYMFFGVGVIGLVIALAFISIYKEEPHQGISGMYGR